MCLIPICNGPDLLIDKGNLVIWPNTLKISDDVTLSILHLNQLQSTSQVKSQKNDYHKQPLHSCTLLIIAGKRMSPVVHYLKNTVDPAGGAASPDPLVPPPRR